jgi:serine/threonine-protein kinase
MGMVWQGRDTVLGRIVAVKVMLPALLADPAFGSRFRAEARMMAALRHPNIVDVYDYGESPVPTGGHVVYLVMAFVDGEPLSERIANAGRLPAAETMAVVAQAADALHAAHDGGIVHRDVKPGNLLIQPDGTVKLVDFGVARSAAVTAVTAADSVPGTAMYMAPEQAAGKPVTAATDVYALGAVAYHCLAGTPPFTGETALGIAMQQMQDEPPPLPADVPAPVLTVVMRALAKNPGERFASAESFAAAARATVGGGGAPTVPAAASTLAAGTAPTRLEALGAPVAGAAGRFAPGVAGADVATRPLGPAGPGRPGGGAGPAGPAGPSGPSGARSGGGWRPAQIALAAGAALLLVAAALLVVLGLTRDDGSPSDAPRTPAPGSTGPAQPGNATTNPTQRPATTPARTTPPAPQPPAPSSAPGGGEPTTPPPDTPAPSNTGGGSPGAGASEGTG